MIRCASQSLGNKTYTGMPGAIPANWVRVEDKASAKTECDALEERTGFDLRPIVIRWYLFRHGTELVAEFGVTEDFHSWKKRLLICEDPDIKEQYECEEDKKE